jgi:hypothetical protein
MLFKIWGFHGGDYEDVVFWDIESQFILHWRHITSPLQSPASKCYVRFVFTSVTMKNAVFGDIKTQFLPHRRHITSTEPSQLMLCKIWGFHGGDYGDCRLLGSYAMCLSWNPTFRRKLAPPSSGKARIGELGIRAATSSRRTLQEIICRYA